MTLVPTDSIVGVVAKLYQESPPAAEVLVRIGLYESFVEQLDAVRAPMTEQVYKNLQEVNAISRRALLRTHVAKALNGEEEPDDQELVEGLAIIEEHVEKGLAGWILDQFNRKHPRDEQGRFTSDDRQTQGPQEQLRGNSGRQQSAIDLAGLTLRTNQRQGERLTRGIFEGDSGKPNTSYGDDRASQWWGQTEGTNRQAYSRLKMTGDLLTRASTPGSTVNVVGNLAQLAGEIGPEAEKVLGPGIRRTAYRYRGTERRPDRTVVSTVAVANAYAEGLNDPERRDDALTQIRSEFAQRKGKYPPAQIAAANASPRMSPDKRSLTVRGDAAVAALIGVMGDKSDTVLPDLDLVRLSLESGEMPPSQGVIITADGKVATQAMGYNGDHYLPFDLRNLGALQGGQYVRSRATGGLTTEDIYTGLMTGARQVQVVSNSGVFTIEFDPDLRGGRRYSDKARRMIERYGSMLEAIDTKELYEPGADLPPEVVSELRAKATRASRSPEEFEETLNRLMGEERMKASNADVSMDELEQAAQNFGRAQADREAEQSSRAGRIMSPQQRSRIASDAAREYRAKNQPTVRRMKLDGVGYNQAMRALKQEFPYFIRRADWRPLDKWLAEYDIDGGDLNYREHAPKDKGYVEPGQTNARGTRSGGFRSARQVPTRGRVSAPAATAAPAAAEKPEGAEQGAPKARGAEAPKPQAITTADLAKPDSPVIRSMGSALQPLLTAIEYAPPAEVRAQDEHEADAESANPLTYLHWKTAQISASAPAGTAGRQFANWLVNEATPHQREKITQALSRLPKHLGSFDMPGDVADTKTAEQMVQRFSDTLSLIEPFAPIPPGEDPAMIEPLGDNPKPPRMEGVPDITAPAEDFDYMEANLRLDRDGDDSLDALIPHYAEIVPEDRAATVRDAWEAATKAQTHEAYQALSNHQTAWSFVHARELAERLRPLVGTDAGPKDQAVTKRQPDRDLTYLEVLRDSLSELDQLLGQSR